MPHVISDIVDVYVFRRLNARVQFLLLQRRADVALPHSWQAFHAQVHAGQTTLQTVRHAVHDLAGLHVAEIFSADYVNQFYDEGRDALVLAPVFAVIVNPQAPVNLADDFRDAAWFDRDEATARLPFSGQRWAVRHIDEIMSLGEAETNIYRIDMDTAQPTREAPDPEVDIANDSLLAPETSDRRPAQADDASDDTADGEESASTEPVGSRPE